MSPELADLSLLELFAMELATHRQSIEDGLVGLESAAGSERLEPLMRAAHSIKGAARIVNLTQAVGLAHAMEDMFQAAQKGSLHLTPAHVDALLAANDFFGRLGAAAPSDMPGLLAGAGDEAATLEKALRALLEAPAGQAVTPGGTPSGVSSAALAGPPGGTVPIHAANPSPATFDASVGSASVPDILVQAISSPETSPGPDASPSAAAQSIHAADSAKPEDGVVRLSAGQLNRLMGLAGECVVEAGVLGRIFSRVRESRLIFFDLAETLAGLQSSLPDSAAKNAAATAQALLATLGSQQAEMTSGMDRLTRRMENLSEKLYAEVLGSRMRPFGEGARPLPRMVRDLARELGKKAQFTLEGSRTSVDRDIMEKLEAPLMHLARNAVDHALEPPGERVALGKPDTGRIVLSARHVAGSLEVRIEDDGRGIDPESLREAVVQKGLASQSMAAAMSRAELFEFLFLPGFSTAPRLTQVSGRGVGLDVVRNMLQEVGGRVRVESEPGRGTTFVLRLPVSRSVLRTLVFEVAGEPYALPLARIGRVAAAEPGEVQSVEGRQYLTMDGQHVGLAPATQVLGLPPSRPRGEELPVVVLDGEHGRYGLAVDALLGERDLVVHPLDPRLGKTPNVLAASILEDGSPVLILDEADLARSLETLLSVGRLDRVGLGSPVSAGREPKRVLVVDDSLTVREVERQLIAGRGYRTVTAVDGMEGLALARMGRFDLIVTDVDMPRMTGIELTRAIKADPALTRTPVMIVSYKDRPEDRLAGLEAGADFYLTKSAFKDDALLQAVADLIGEP